MIHIHAFVGDDYDDECGRCRADSSAAVHQPVCANCGDSFGAPERPCPDPSPGRPYVDCGRGGHMFKFAATKETPMQRHRWVRDPKGATDETCRICGSDPRNDIHHPGEPVAQSKLEEIKQAIKRLDAAHANLAVISPRRSAAALAWDQAQAHLQSASADESRARDEIAEARSELYALVDNAFKEAP